MISILFRLDFTLSAYTFWVHCVAISDEYENQRGVLGSCREDHLWMLFANTELLRIHD